MEQMNQAMLAKTSWELSEQINSLWKSMLTAKYLKNTTFWEASQKASDSSMWKGILKSKELLMKGRCFQIYNGESVNIWLDPWIPTLINFKPKPLQGMDLELPNLTVSDLIINNSRIWDVPKMQALFDH